MLNIPKHNLNEIHFFIDGLKYPIVVYGNANQHAIIEKISEITPYHVNTIARYCRENKICFQELRTMCKKKLTNIQKETGYYGQFLFISN